MGLRTRRLLWLLILVALLLGLYPVKAIAGSVFLAWDPNTEADLAGYKIYIGNSSRTYIQAIDVGRVTTLTLPNLLDGETYFFAVTAYDIFANESGFSNEFSITTGAAGSDCAVIESNAFYGCYYGNINFTDLKVTRIDNQINFNWGTGSPNPLISSETFSARWQGKFTFDQADYEFTVTADDGVRLYVDGALILDKWFDQYPTTYKVKRSLTAGTHIIKMEFYENGGGAVAKLSWGKLATSCSTVNSGSFYGCYYDNKDLTNLKLTRTDSQINFNWGTGSPGSLISSETFSARWQGKFTFDQADYEFTVTADDGVRLYVDGALILDKWFDQYPTTYKVKRSLTAGTHIIKMEFYENGGGAVAKLLWTR